jgi:hypothetical protein
MSVQTDLVPFIENTWFLAVAMGAVALSFVAELLVGTTVG